MGEVKHVNEWKKIVEPALQCKVNELKWMGYSEAAMDDLWNCLMDKVWKNNQEKRIHEIVQDIFQLKSNTYMSYLTVLAQGPNDEDDLMASIQAINSMEN